MFIATLIPIFIFSAYILVPDIKIRINNVLTFVNHPVVTSNTHMSIYAIVSNAFIAFKSFTNNVLFGMGLGSHPISYDRFFNLGALKGFLNPALTLGDGAGVCKGDSGSLFLRLFSETGLFGVIVVFYFIIRFRFRNDNNNSLFVMNSAAFILFILVLLRQGHYFYNGLFFFVWIYYFSYKIYNKTDPKILVENK